MSHPDDSRYCNPCGMLFFDRRQLKQHRIAAHGAVPPCHKFSERKWCDYDRTTNRVHLGGFMGHTCVR